MDSVPFQGATKTPSKSRRPWRVFSGSSPFGTSGGSPCKHSHGPGNLDLESNRIAFNGDIPTTWNAKCPIFLGNSTPKTSNYCLKNKVLGFPGRHFANILGWDGFMKELHPFDVYLSKRTHGQRFLRQNFAAAQIRRRVFFCERNVGHQLQGILCCRNGEVVYFRFTLHQQNLT